MKKSSPASLTSKASLVIIGGFINKRIYIMNELESLATLCALPLLGSVRIQALIHAFGSTEEVLRLQPEEILSLTGFGEKIAESFKMLRQGKIFHDLELAEKKGIKVIPYTSSLYPRLLLELPDKPLLLYVKGDLSCAAQSLAVVGTRFCSIYGKEMSEKISKDLSRQGLTVVSGLAHGIDTAAHLGALNQGKTIAVIGSGLGRLYPRENSLLAEKIADQGALVSEYPINTPPDKGNFPQRNRIVSGISLGTLLIEAPIKSGAMITMEFAKRQRKKRFAIPGRIDIPSFSGNHDLIKKGEAQLIENASDILKCYENLFPQEFNIKDNTGSLPPLEQEEKHFLELMPHEEIGFDHLAAKTKLPIIKMNVLIMSLILKGYLKEFPGKLYKKSI